ncbi:MYND-type domain-containing protein [Mycena chlorophos]|uniref:MYND-type domain-containing protein n=1 Tax=Mycena chlorophos TaxID=658473 RepID=A0A8H6SWP9_MYCCL|nr:MYND-type domain-containing protein [Mycena chlorophos]
MKCLMIIGPNLATEIVDMGPKLPKPSRVECFVCKEPGEDLKRCGKCKMVSYCSRECQKRDWENHKVVCFKYSIQSANKANKKTGNASTPPTGTGTDPSPKLQPPARPLATICEDMRRHRAVHEASTFRLLIMDALDLTHDLSSAETHFIALTMRRNLTSNDPFALYALLDAVVLPMSAMEPISMGGPDGIVWPLKQHRSQLKQARRDKSLTGPLAVVGGALVVCMELGVNYPVDYYGSVEEALNEGSDGMHPITVEITQEMLPMLKQLKREPEWKTSLKNAFDGYLYAAQKREIPAELKEPVLQILQMSDEAEAEWKRAQKARGKR